MSAEATDPAGTRPADLPAPLPGARSYELPPPPEGATTYDLEPPE
jgi:hypothetical protein